MAVRVAPSTRRSTRARSVVDTGPVLPNVSLSGAQSKNEGNSGPTLFTYTVSRNITTGAVVVPWSFAAGSTSADDFTGGAYPTGGNVNLADGVASGTFTVSVNGDTIVEPDETFTVSISAPNGYALGTSSATGTILNDDAAGAANRRLVSTGNYRITSAGNYRRAA